VAKEPAPACTEWQTEKRFPVAITTPGALSLVKL